MNTFLSSKAAHFFHQTGLSLTVSSAKAKEKKRNVSQPDLDPNCILQNDF